MKICCTCKEEKEFVAFYRDRKNKDGYDYSCKKCASDKAKESIERRRQKWRESYYKNHERYKKYNQKYRDKNRDLLNEKKRKFRSENKDKLNRIAREITTKTPQFLARSREYNRKYYKKSREKQLPMRQAHKMVMYAVKLGLMQRPDTCEKCGIKGKMDGHHEDYTKPLEVNWWCRDCHANHHNRIYPI